MYDDEPKQAEVARVGSKLPLSHQEKSIAELHEAIKMLQDRLTPILTPMPESDPTDKVGEDRAAIWPLAEQLGANNAGITRATRKIRSIMEILEC